MSRYRLLSVLLLVLFSLKPSFAKDSANVLGTWKLVSYEVVVQATGEKMFPMGKHPTGYVIFTPEPRVWFILTGEARKPAKTRTEKAVLLDSLISYSGKYRLEGDKWITSVDVAWNPAWVGAEESRTFTVKGTHLQVYTPWRLMPNWSEKGPTRSIVSFERVAPTQDLP